MELEFTLEKSDLLAYAQFVQKARSRSWKSGQVKYMAGFVIVNTVLVTIGVILAFTGSVAPLLMAAGIFLCLFLFAKTYLKWIFKTYYAEKFFPDMFVPQKIMFSEKALLNIRQTSKCEYAWNAFIDIVHAEKHTYFVLPSFTGLVLPHRIFRNSTELQGFRDRLNAMSSKGKANSKSMLSITG